MANLTQEHLRRAASLAEAITAALHRLGPEWEAITEGERATRLGDLLRQIDQLERTLGKRPSPMAQVLERLDQLEERLAQGTVLTDAVPAAPLVAVSSSQVIQSFQQAARQMESPMADAAAADGAFRYVVSDLTVDLRAAVVRDNGGIALALPDAAGARPDQFSSVRMTLKPISQDKP